LISGLGTVPFFLRSILNCGIFLAQVTQISRDEGHHEKVVARGIDIAASVGMLSHQVLEMGR
jgi:hypothetical protein